MIEPEPVTPPDRADLSEIRGDRSAPDSGRSSEVSPGDVKQVIVIRRDLNMRRGKEIAQGAHASSAWLAFAVAKAVDQTTGQAIVELDEVARV